MKGVSNFPKAFCFFALALALASALASAYDPSPLQDFCVAINNITDGVFVNGKFCKDPKVVTADDFFFQGLKNAGNTSTPVGSVVTPAFVDQFAGLNTLGIAMARIDFAPNGGLNPPHIHPRASEIFLLLEGKLLVGFVASNQNNHTLFSKVINPGEIFSFPIGMIHFQLNLADVPAVGIAALSSQSPGVITIANTVFGSNPPINPDVLVKAFMLDKTVVQYLQSKF